MSAYVPEHVYHPHSWAKHQIHRWKANEALHPETKNGANQHSSLRQVGEPSDIFNADTSAERVQSERAVQRDAEPRSVSMSAVMEVGGVFFLTLDCNDRAGIAYTIERLINLLDGWDGDPDFEIEELEEQHDAEAEDAEPNGDEGDYGRCEDDARADELYRVPFGPLTGGQGL